jgi:APA family basic amino acid/polyamine antiporter
VGGPRRVLSLFDVACLTIGIVVGAGIYQTAPAVAGGAGSGWGLLAIWLAGGLLSLCGALGYAELATALPQQGGDLVYLSRAYGPWAGFLFGWIQTLIVRPGDIAVMAFAFALYARAALGSAALGERALAMGAVLVLTGVNLLGVRMGKWTQNTLTVIKLLGLLAVIAAAALAPVAGAERLAPAVGAAPALPLSVALILVLFTYGGWNEMVYVAAEVRDPRRNIGRALILGTAGVTLLYLLANGAFLRALGYGGLASAEAVAVAAVAGAAPAQGARLVGGLICLSALGALSGLIFAGARIAYALGLDHRAFRALGRWSAQRGSPPLALACQGLIALVLILVLGSFVETLLYTAAAVYLFYFATSVAVIVLRRREPQLERPFRVPGYPWPILIFGATCLFLIRAAIVYRPRAAAVAAGLILLGLPGYWWSARCGRS